jgi:hypothetical protein
LSVALIAMATIVSIQSSIESHHANLRRSWRCYSTGQQLE